MADQTCPCGSIGIHPHHIDGNVVWLCAKCHAVLRCTTQNTSGMDVLSFFLLCSSTNDWNLVHGWEKEEPVSDVVGTKQLVLDEDSLFLPLREDHNEVTRRPPSRHITIGI